MDSFCQVQAYGRTTYLITTLQRVPRGTEGAISAEGTAAGAAAAVLFSGIAILVGQVAHALKLLHGCLSTCQEIRSVKSVD